MNRRRSDFQSLALPSELPRHHGETSIIFLDYKVNCLILKCSIFLFAAACNRILLRLKSYTHCAILFLEKKRMDEKEIREILFKKNGDFRKAALLHKEYEKMLDGLRKKSCLSNEDELKEKELKKKKLTLKDKMHWMISEYKKNLND